MKKTPPILFIFSFVLIALTHAQVDSDAYRTADTLGISADRSLDSLHAEMDKIINPLIIEYNKYKEYAISRDSVRKNWLKEKIGVNNICDTFLFQNKHYDLETFNLVIEKYLLTHVASDTTVFQLDYGDHLNIGNYVGTFKILGDQIEKHKGHGAYYFTIYSLPIQPITKEKYVRADTIDLYMNKKIKYNGKNLDYSDLLSLLQTNKPERLILRTVKELPVQDLFDVMQLGNNLKLTMILAPALVQP